jgi:hypothetical protein
MRKSEIKMLDPTQSKFKYTKQFRTIVHPDSIISVKLWISELLKESTSSMRMSVPTLSREYLGV